MYHITLLYKLAFIVRAHIINSHANLPNIYRHTVNSDKRTLKDEKR